MRWEFSDEQLAPRAADKTSPSQTGCNHGLPWPRKNGANVSNHTKSVLLCVLSMFAASAVHAYDVDRAHNHVVLSSLDDFERCQVDLSDSDVCVDALKRYVKANPKSGFAAGKLVRAQFSHWVALQFFVPMLTKESAGTYCDDEDLRLAVLAGLALATGDPNQALAAKAATGVCAAKLQPHIRNGFADANPFYRRNACAVLTKLHAAPLECGANTAAR